MAGSYLTPMLLLTGISAANSFYNTKDPTKMAKPLVAGGIATGILAIFNNVPSLGQVTTGIAWVAFVAFMISPSIQNPPPVQNLLKITGGL